MGSAGLRRQATELLDEGIERFEFVDLAIDLYEWDDKTRLASVGGRWDLEEDGWSDDPPETAVRWRVQPAQYEAARFAVDWLEARARGERVAGAEDIYTLMAIGGRGGGKSDFGVRLGILIAITFAESICWYVSPVQRETTELERAIESMVPEGWYHYADNTYHFWNGSTITMMSGYDPGTLKQGRVDYFLLNEAQRFPKEAYKMVAPRTADKSGLGYLACNPPREAKGRWVQKFHDRLVVQGKPGYVANDNDIRDIKLLEFDARKNTTIDFHRLELLRGSFGDLDYRREIEGEMLPIGDLVFYSWKEAENVAAPPELGNITARMSKLRLGSSFAHVIAMDFNKQPWMAARQWALFVDPDDPDGALAWLVNEWTVKGSEDDLLDEIEGTDPWGGQVRYGPETTGLVLDASAWKQSPIDPKGKPSQQIIAARDYACYRPKRGLKKNPPVVERIVLANALFGTTDDRRRAFASPNCPMGAEEIKSWPNTKWGEPDKRSDYAHGCDASTYFLYRFYPRLVTQQRRFRYYSVDSTTERDRDLRRF